MVRGKVKFRSNRGGQSREGVITSESRPVLARFAGRAVSSASGVGTYRPIEREPDLNLYLWTAIAGSLVAAWPLVCSSFSPDEREFLEEMSEGLDMDSNLRNIPEKSDPYLVTAPDRAATTVTVGSVSDYKHR
ncbi:13331_t:CDS:2, partial [Acaulospora colombiana]